MAPKIEKTKSKNQTPASDPQTYKQTPSSKDIALSHLKKAGFVARNDKGVLVIYYKDASEFESLTKTIPKFLSEIVYNSSWGIRFLNNSELQYDNTSD